jgi:hypothetical protein
MRNVAIPHHCGVPRASPLEKCVIVNGEDACFREGDIVYSRYDRIFPSYFISRLNRGISHVAIILKFNGILYHVDSTMQEYDGPDDQFLQNENGFFPKRGVHGQLLDSTFDDKYKHLWIQRPHVPYTEKQLVAMRRKAMDMLNEGTAQHSTYEKSFFARDYLHAIMGWQRHTERRYMCSETIASILKAGGRLSGRVCIMPVDIVNAIDGDMRQLF